MNYLQGVPHYTGRLLWRMDTVVGILVSLVFFIVAVATGVSQDIIVFVTLAIVVLSAIEAGYGLYREERVMRSRLEQNVRVTAKLGSFSANVPDPGPQKVSIKAGVQWEVWVKEDVSTDQVALNIIYTYDKPWWKIWKRTTFPQKGIPPDGADSTLYRKRINANETQPFKGSATFEFVGDRYIEGDPHWELELVLITGMPAGVHRIPVYIDYEEMQSRGTNPPL